MGHNINKNRIVEQSQILRIDQIVQNFDFVTKDTEFITLDGHLCKVVAGDAPDEVQEYAKEKGINYSDNPSMICAYGQKIYIKGMVNIPIDILVHESVHIDQQIAYGNIGSYLYAYFENATFRLHNELEAYSAQCAALRVMDVEDDECRKKVMQMAYNLKVMYALPLSLTAHELCCDMLIRSYKYLLKLKN